MKRYGQRCPAARTLDVIGERWTLLVIRDLLLGPRRYTDLLEGLPGIGTNVLATRLADLQANGVIAKRTLPPPTPVAVYELTEAGEALASVMTELRAWGQQYAPAPEAGDAARPGWVLASAATRAPGLSAGRVCEVRVDGEVFELTGTDGQLTVRACPARDPDATLTIAPKLFFGLATGRLTPARAGQQAAIEGDATVAADVIATLAGAAA
jgi:DNA-binding HxlR family transcriptional regulator